MRKVLSLLLLAGSVLMAVIIFVQKTPEKIVAIGSPAELLTTANKFSAESVPALVSSEPSSEINQIGLGIAEEIIAQNPEGPEISDEGRLITAPDPKKIAEKIIKERLSQSSFALLTPEIDLNSLKIVPNNDPAFVNAYLENAKAISASNFAGINIDFTDPDVEDFKKLAAAYEKTINDYYALNVPSSMLALHKEKLTLFMQQKKIFTNIANIEKDPLAALVSMRLLGRAYDDLTNINERIIQFAQKYNL